MKTIRDTSWTMRFLPDALRELRVAPKGVIHVGAHWGEEVPTYVQLRFGTIVLVEPDPESCAKIEEQPWFPSITALHQAAVASVGDRARFYRVPVSVWSGLKRAEGHEPPTAEFDVTVVRADALQRDHPEANVLVVDTQGTELDALDSADLSTLDLAIVETQREGKDGAHPAELDAYAHAKGWEVAIVWDRTGGWTDTLIVPRSV